MGKSTMDCNNKVFVKLAIVVFCIVASMTGFSNKVFADYEWASGGQGGDIYGSGGPEYDTYYDCTGNYGNSRCPRWILVPNSVYQIIRSENRMVGTYSTLPACENDSYLMIAGNQRYDGSLQIFNMYREFAVAPYKDTHVLTSVATSINNADVLTANGYTVEERNLQNFFSWPNGNGVKGSDGHTLTYQEVLNEIMRLSGLSEDRIAVACPSMVEVTYTLTGYPVDIAGNSITTDGTNWSDTVTSGSKASISAGWNANYTFLGWRTNRTSGTPSGTTTYTVNSLTSDKVVYAVYGKKPTLTGKSINIVDNSSLASVSGLSDKTKTVEYNKKAEVTRGTNSNYVFKGWRTSETGSIVDTKATYSVNNLKENKTVYAVYAPYRTLSGEAVVNDAECTIMSGYNPDSKTVEWNTRAVLQHESIPNLTFEGWRSTKCSGDLYNNEDYVVEHLQTDTKVYAVYSPNILPCANSAAVLGSDCDSSIRIEQSKDNEHWVTNTMYMKPGDTVYVKGYFNPQYQDKKDIRPQKLAITSSSYENNSNGRTIEDYFNLKVNPDWNNAFFIRYNNQRESDSWGCKKLVEGVIGNNGEYFGVYNYNARLGKEGRAKAVTNECTNADSTPKKIHFSYDAGYNLQANIDNSSSESNIVIARTPYNFINTINIETEEGIVYAGETKNINYKIAVNPKTNNLTTDGSEEQAYATDVPNAKVKFRLTYEDGTEDYTDEIELGTISAANNSNNNEEMTINIRDLPAGTRVTIEAGIYPATSGSNGNWNNEKGDDKWAWSGKKTFIIAKKPSFQVLGGSVYSNGGIAAPAAVKSHVHNVYNHSVYKANGVINGGAKVAFGSWAENAVIANGAVNGLASGAATGLNLTSAAIGHSYYYGIAETGDDNYCNNRVPLSFANYIPASLGCPDRPITGLLGASNSILDRAALVSYILGNENTINTQLTPNDNNEYILGTKEIFAGTTEVVTAAGDTITIAGNLTYADESYSTLEQVPKLIVYADNINIACDVTRVDAILIANNKIDTCPNSDGTNDEGIARINEAKNNNQLLVNGIIVTNTLDLNRTYGAATGTNSGIPAEIVNYDASTILWSTSQTTTDDYSNMTIVYQHEMAPRQ